MPKQTSSETDSIVLGPPGGVALQMNREQKRALDALPVPEGFKRVTPEDSKKMGLQGHRPHSMIVDETYEQNIPLDNEPVSDPQTPQELFDAGWITFEQYREMTRSEPLPPETQALLDQIDVYDAAAQAYLLNKVAAGRAAMKLQGFNTEYKKNLPKLGSNPKLHQKAVERRKKRKNGGHK